MSRVRFKLDHKGIEAWMKQELKDESLARANAMADAIRSQTTAEVTVDYYETDRPHPVVAVLNGGAAREAKYGYLARAATAQGLHVGPPRGRS